MEECPSLLGLRVVYRREEGATKSANLWDKEDHGSLGHQQVTLTHKTLLNFEFLMQVMHNNGIFHHLGTL